MKKMLMVILLTLMPVISYARCYDYASMLPISVTVNTVTAYKQATILGGYCLQDNTNPDKYKFTFDKGTYAFSYSTKYIEVYFDRERDVPVCMHVQYNNTDFKQLFNIMKSMADEIWVTEEDSTIVTSCVFSNCLIYFFNTSPVVGVVIDNIEGSIASLKRIGTKVR